MGGNLLQGLNFFKNLPKIHDESNAQFHTNPVKIMYLINKRNLLLFLLEWQVTSQFHFDENKREKHFS